MDFTRNVGSSNDITATASALCKGEGTLEQSKATPSQHTIAAAAACLLPSRIAFARRLLIKKKSVSNCCLFAVPFRCLPALPHVVADFFPPPSRLPSLATDRSTMLAAPPPTSYAAVMHRKRIMGDKAADDAARATAFSRSNRIKLSQVAPTFLLHSLTLVLLQL